MKATDLRIGNFVRLNPEKVTSDRDIIIVEDVDSVEINSWSTGDNLSNLLPVPLTEEWLIKFGFTKRESLIIDSYEIDISSFVQERKVLSITIQPGNQYIHLRCGDLSEPRDADDLITIRNGDIHGQFFVHQLQNLYHALTGEELQVK